MRISTKYIILNEEVLKKIHPGLSLKILKNSRIVNMKVPKTQDYDPLSKSIDRCLNII